MANTFGEVDWADDNTTSGDRSSRRDLYLRLEAGSNTVRIVTNPFQYLVHRSVKAVGTPGFGKKVWCSIANGSCPVCEKGLKNNTRWLVGVIDRKANAYKVLDISWAVYSQIKKLNNNKIWGDPKKYDIDIVVDKDGGATGYYTVQPHPPTPLSAADQTIRDNVDLEDLKKAVAPPTVEAAQKRLDKVLDGGTLFIPEEAQSKKEAKATTSATKNGHSVNTTVVQADDMDDVFPEYNAS